MEFLILVCSICLFFSWKSSKPSKGIFRLLSTLLILFFLETLISITNLVYLFILWGVLGNTFADNSYKTPIKSVFFFNLIEHIFFIFLFIWQCYLAGKCFTALDIMDENKPKKETGEVNLYIISEEKKRFDTSSRRQLSKRTINSLKKQALRSGILLLSC